jgi:hypothetical protein
VPEEESEGNMSLDGSTTKGLFGAFGFLNTGRNSIGTDFWNHRLAQTPPPPSFPRTESAMSEEMTMDSPIISSNNGSGMPAPDQSINLGWTSRASTPQSMNPPTAADGLKKSNKRRRDNSPVISQSPSQRDSSLWGTAAKASRETSISGQSNGERSNSGGSMSMTPTLGPKRVGLQGMTDTSDGLMKMSIE